MKTPLCLITNLAERLPGDTTPLRSLIHKATRYLEPSQMATTVLLASPGTLEAMATTPEIQWYLDRSVFANLPGGTIHGVPRGLYSIQVKACDGIPEGTAVILDAAGSLCVRIDGLGAATAGDTT